MTVYISFLVLEGIQEAIADDTVNEYHHTEVRAYCFENQYYDTATWIKNHHTEYSEGLMTGFETESETIEK